jgi:hypothetical protein
VRLAAHPHRNRERLSARARLEAHGPRAIGGLGGVPLAEAPVAERVHLRGAQHPSAWGGPHGEGDGVVRPHDAGTGLTDTTLSGSSETLTTSTEAGTAALSIPSRAEYCPAVFPASGMVRTPGPRRWRVCPGWEKANTSTRAPVAGVREYVARATPSPSTPSVTRASHARTGLFSARAIIPLVGVPAQTGEEMGTLPGGANGPGVLRNGKRAARGSGCSGVSIPMVPEGRRRHPAAARRDTAASRR